MCKKSHIDSFYQVNRYYLLDYVRTALYINSRNKQQNTETMTQLEKFADQIQDVAMFAKAQRFDIENGDFDQLMKDWVKNRKELYHEDNKEEVKRIIKQFI